MGGRRHIDTKPDAGRFVTTNMLIGPPVGMVVCTIAIVLLIGGRFALPDKPEDIVALPGSLFSFLLGSYAIAFVPAALHGFSMRLLANLGLPRRVWLCVLPLSGGLFGAMAAYLLFVIILAGDWQAPLRDAVLYNGPALAGDCRRCPCLALWLSSHNVAGVMPAGDPPRLAAPLAIAGQFRHIHREIAH